MSDIAIRVENLGKHYRLGKSQERHDTLRDTVMAAARAPFAAWRRQDGRAAARSHELWALRDVSFEVRQGEVVGVIGRNGAGKSTLLKILSRITEPTTGRAVVQGRVGSLLEVGTGFHPELSGRENIYLNGAILGMRRSEIARKFDEIVAFSEIERFLDTPVKRYSSGMYVRLAFAVAAHLEPEVLVVDEVLAVGDAQFQQKCLGKMQDVAHDGRTVLFVSHNMDAVQRLCTRCLLLARGTIGCDGAPAEAVERYLSESIVQAGPAQWIDVSHIPSRGSQLARFVAVQYSSENRAVSFRPYTYGPLVVQLAIESDAPRTVNSVAVALYNRSGTMLVNADTVKLGHPIYLSQGRNVVRLRIDRLYLHPGSYRVGLYLADPVEVDRGGEPLDHREQAIEIEVIETETKGFGMRPAFDGAVVCEFQATHEALTDEKQAYVLH